VDQGDEQQRMTAYLSARTARTHAAFLLPHLRPGARILDCGCGPGSITRELAALVPGSAVVGVDADAAKLAVARRHGGAEFVRGSVYALPFPAESFDGVLARALFQHLADPERALAELYRVTARGGVVGVRAPDWSALLLYPDPPPVRRAVERFVAIHYADGNPCGGRALAGQFRRAGFDAVQFAASFECAEAARQGQDLAGYLSRRGESEAAAALTEWSTGEGQVFAQAWCEVVGTRCPEVETAAAINGGGT
jgi:SAM-dependent methyltransferase